MLNSPDKHCSKDTEELELIISNSLVEMSVQNIIDPATGQIDNSLINVAGLGVVTNPLTATLQGQTAYGMTDANVVSTGVLQTDNIQAYSVLPGAPVAITSDVKFQTPAKQIDFEDTTGANVIASLSDLNISGTIVKLEGSTDVRVEKPSEPSLLLRESVTGIEANVGIVGGYAGIYTNQAIKLQSEAIHPGACLVAMEGGGVGITAGTDDPKVTVNAQGGAIYCKMKADGNTNETGLEASGVFKINHPSGLIKLDAGVADINASTAINVETFYPGTTVKASANGNAIMTLDDTEAKLESYDGVATYTGTYINGQAKTHETKVVGYTAVFCDELNSRFQTDAGSGQAGLKYDGAGSPSFVQFHLSSGGTPDDFVVNTAGASTGTYLRIFINGTPYKIALLAEA